MITGAAGTAAQLEKDPLPQRAAAIALLVPPVLYLLVPAVACVQTGPGPIALSDTLLIQSWALQLLLCATLGVWLWRLGWRPHRTATRPFAGADLLRGLGLWVAAFAAVVGWALVCRTLLPDVFAAATEIQFTGRPHLAVVVPYALFNAVFEEVLWLGLGFAAFRRMGIVWAGALSIALRIMIHAYQGPLAVITIVPMAVLFTAYYIQTRRLWPIVVAHAFQDLLSLGALALGAGPRAV